MPPLCRHTAEKTPNGFPFPHQKNGGQLSSGAAPLLMSASCLPQKLITSVVPLIPPDIFNYAQTGTGAGVSE